MTDFIEVKHEGVKGTAKVPASALKHMKGWTPVDESPDSDAGVELKGQALDAALRDAGLSLEGTADEKRARLAEHTDTNEEN